MTKLFTVVLNMSITASYVAIAVMIIRILLKKVSIPKSFSYILWLAVLIRLVFPFGFNSAFSFFSFIKPANGTGTASIEYVPYKIGLMQKPAVDVGINGINNAVNSSLPPATPYASVNPMQIDMWIASIIWIIGMAALFGYFIISYLKILSKVKTATLIKDNIFETDRITTPFLCGVITPKIYVPLGIAENELPYVIEHEKVHIKRWDYIIKPFAFLVLILHWFNPVMWVSFRLMSKDMEMSCDELVIKKMGSEAKGSYSKSLLSLSMKNSGFNLGSPICFGESNIKSRIKNILSYKKPALCVLVLAIAAIGLLTVAFTTNPKENKTISNTYFGYSIKMLMNNKTQYVGNNSKVTHLIDAMPLPEGIARSTVELQTTAKPYGITINFNINEASGTKLKDTMEDAFYRNSIMLFSLVENADIVNCKVVDSTNKNAGAAYSFSYTREAVQKLIGEDVRHYADSEELLKRLIDKIKIMSLRANALNKAADVSQIEKNLGVIMSSPLSSSNPKDYMKAHQKEYEDIVKMGNGALNYLLLQFEKGGNDNLRGQIMMALCKEMLGNRNNVTDESLSPQQWFSKLSLQEEIRLPDFKANVSDLKEQLVYDAAVKKYSRSGYGFTVVAPTIFGSFEEGNKLKIIATVYSSSYKLYGKTLSEVGGSVVPAAITYTKGDDGKYTLQEYKECMDGSEFGKSIEEFCTMPVSGKTIKGLYSKIMQDYGSNKIREELLMKNLKEHLENNNQSGIILKYKSFQKDPVTLT